MRASLQSVGTRGAGGVDGPSNHRGGPIVAGIQVRVHEILGWANSAFATSPMLRVLTKVLRSEQVS